MNVGDERIAVDERLFDIQDFSGYRIFSLPSKHIDAAMEFAQKQGLDGVAISSASGYNESDLSPLRDYPWIKAIVLPTAAKIDIKDLRFLTNLQLLALEGNRQPLSLEWFPALRWAGIDWHSTMELGPGSLRLEFLQIRRFSDSDLSRLTRFPKLLDLSLVQSRCESLRGICILRRLSRLQLAYMRRLSDISALNECGCLQLESLELERCPLIKDCSAIENAPQLVSLLINDCGEIADISFVRSLPRLRKLRLIGTTIENGDLSPILKVKTLESFGISGSRKHTHTERQILDHLGIARRTYS